MNREELLAKKAIEIWESTEGSYIDVSNWWEDEWLDTWKQIVKIVLQVQADEKESI